MKLVFVQLSPVLFSRLIFHFEAYALHANTPPPHPPSQPADEDVSLTEGEAPGLFFNHTLVC